MLKACAATPTCAGNTELGLCVVADGRGLNVGAPGLIEGEAAPATPAGALEAKHLLACLAVQRRGDVRALGNIVLVVDEHIAQGERQFFLDVALHPHTHDLAELIDGGLRRVALLLACSFQEQVDASRDVHKLLPEEMRVAAFPIDHQDPVTLLDLVTGVCSIPLCECSTALDGIDEELGLFHPRHSPRDSDPKALLTGLWHVELHAHLAFLQLLLLPSRLALQGRGVWAALLRLPGLGRQLLSFGRLCRGLHGCSGRRCTLLQTRHLHLGRHRLHGR
mmetsp:Transcript_92310/g.214488  ORF Transcript_92310/g.214488 Transcript_92310/m.214488 type:complete len:278 (+) Transcript_92310:813-1646(+)